MATPVPPGGREGSPGGGPAPPLPLSGPPGSVGPADPPGPPLTGATLLAQMVAAMQVAAAGLPAPGPGGPALWSKTFMPRNQNLQILPLPLEEQQPPLLS